jgi:hypothetical protein
MTAYDVFNGDADGLCALQQLRLADPKPSKLVTGVKRDIQLLRRISPGPGDEVTVLDISLDSNRADLQRILDAGARVTYFDHHFSGDVPEHEAFRPHLDDSSGVCTSLLVDRYLQGTHRLWAIVGAAGDNLDGVAFELAGPLVSGGDWETLRELGRLLNYNGYGRTLQDLHFAPDELHRKMRPYADPLDFIASEPVFSLLREGYSADMAKAEGLEPLSASASCAVYVLPDEAWTRRISGEIANALVRRFPSRALAVVVPNTSTCYLVSLRVPAEAPNSASEFCGRFPSGGGRRTAGGINHLPAASLEAFVRDFRSVFA